MVIIIYGYFLLLGIILVICFFTGIYLGYRSYTAQDNETKKRLEDLDMSMESDEAETMTTKTARSKLMDSSFAQNNHPMVVKTMQSIRKKKTMQVSDDSSSGVRS